MRHTVPADFSHERLDQYLTRLLPQLSRAQIQRLIAKSHIQVNGRVSKASHRVMPGEEISIEIPPPAPITLKPQPIPLSILYEDSSLLIVDKPAGLVVHPAPGHPSGTLVNALLNHGTRLSSVAGPFKPGIVHRLDKDTSGLMVVAKEDEVHRELAQQFADRKVRRVYVALVKGKVPQEEGTIDAPIGRHPVRRQKMAVLGVLGTSLKGTPYPQALAHRVSPLRTSPKQAVTRYRVLKRFPSATLLELYPQTGRTHQLRVHLAHLGHPILGDTRYGVKAQLPRQALHSKELGLKHPKTGRWIQVRSALPKDLQEAIKKLASEKGL